MVGGIVSGFVVQHLKMAANLQAKELLQGGFYTLNPVEVVVANYSNSAGSQPSYYIWDNGNLRPTANIMLPAGTKIAFTITAHDMANASIASQFLRLVRIVGNSINVVNGSIATEDNTSHQWRVTGSAFSTAQALHNFTIVNNGTVLVNIPVIPGTTGTGVFYANSTGTFSCQCEASYGTGDSGWTGTMATHGWMSGSVEVV